MPKKLKNEGIIPSTMSGKRFSTLSDLGSALGFKPAEQPTPRSMKCRKCGTAMRNIPGTNVWVCDGMVEKDKDGVKKMEACGNLTMTSIGPRPQSSDNPGNAKPKRPKNPGKTSQVQTTTA